jgi:anti-sigma factor RsiW
VADSKPEPNEGNADERQTEEIVAYLDGELDVKEAEGLTARLSLDPKLRAEAESLQRTWDILDILPRPQPSSSFTTRTLSQAIPIPSGASGPTLAFPQPGAASTMMFAPPKPGIVFWLASAAIIVLAVGIGYFAHRELAPKPTVPEPSLEDAPLMRNLRLYRNVEDMEYLKRLDSPEMFGEEGE